MSDAIYFTRGAKGSLTIGDRREIDKAEWRRPWRLKLTPTSRYILNRLLSEGFIGSPTARKVWAAVVGSHDIIRRSSGLGSRELALKLGGTSAVWANAVWTACSMGGAAVIFLFGLLLFLASLGPARPF